MATSPADGDDVRRPSSSAGVVVSFGRLGGESTGVIYGINRGSGGQARLHFNLSRLTPESFMGGPNGATDWTRPTACSVVALGPPDACVCAPATALCACGSNRDGLSGQQVHEAVRDARGVSEDRCLCSRWSIFWTFFNFFLAATLASIPPTWTTCTDRNLGHF